MKDPNEYTIIENPKSIDFNNGKNDKDELLENIISSINDKYNGIFSHGDRVIVETIYGKVIKNNKKLKTYAKKNNIEVFSDSIFPKVFADVTQECYEEQMDSFKKLFEDKEFYATIMAEIAKEAYRGFRNE